MFEWLFSIIHHLSNFYPLRVQFKLTTSLKEEMTPAEEEILKDYITGQNSDGWGEHFEQQPIDTDDGDLYVSFWNTGDDYAIMTQDELDEYIGLQGVGDRCFLRYYTDPSWSNAPLWQNMRIRLAEHNVI